MGGFSEIHNLYILVIGLLYIDGLQSWSYMSEGVFIDKAVAVKLLYLF